MKLKDLNRFIPETELCQIGKKCKTDKPGNGYTRVYYELLKDFRNDPINLFEIGIYFGASIRMWHDFFSIGKIYGIDNGRIVPGSKMKTGMNNSFPSTDDVKLLQYEAVVENLNYPWLENKRIKCYTADQRSLKQLNESFKHFECNSFDVILDDGQHFQEHQQKSLGLLFPFIKSGKYYIIEDVIDKESMINGANYWGQKRKDASDSTDHVFTTFLETGKLESIYLNSNQIEYILNNIDDIFLYQNNNRNNSPINGTSKLLIIKKK